MREEWGEAVGDRMEIAKGGKGYVQVREEGVACQPTRKTLDA
jgi:hypothetical protein